MHDNLRGGRGSRAIANGFAPIPEAASPITINTIVTRRPGMAPELELHHEEMMSQLGWILGSVSRVVAVGRKGDPGRMRRRPWRARGATRRSRVVDLGRGLGAEPLEVRALLSGQTVSLIKDVNAVETDPVNLTPAGSNLFYTVEDSTDTGADLMVTNASGTQVLLDTGTPALKGSFANAIHLTAAGNSVFFVQTLPDLGPEFDPPTSDPQETRLWISDGNPASSQLIGAPSFEYQGQLYFLSSNPGTPSTGTIGIFDAGGDRPTVTGIPGWLSSDPVAVPSWTRPRSLSPRWDPRSWSPSPTESMRTRRCGRRTGPQRVPGPWHPSNP